MAAGKIDPMHQFMIAPVGSDQLAASPFQFTNSALWMLVVLAVIVAFMWGGLKRQLVPGRWQAAVELLTGFLDNVTTQSIGGLLGSAILGTYVTVRTKVHAAALVQRIVLTDPIVAQRVSQLEAAYGRVITDKAQLGTQGLNLLNQQVTREANVLAYNDLFLLVAALAGLALTALLIHMAILALGRLVADPQPAN